MQEPKCFAFNVSQRSVWFSTIYLYAHTRMSQRTYIDCAVNMKSRPAIPPSAASSCGSLVCIRCLIKHRIQTSEPHNDAALGGIDGLYFMIDINRRIDFTIAWSGLSWNRIILRKLVLRIKPCGSRLNWTMECIQLKLYANSSCMHALGNGPLPICTILNTVGFWESSSRSSTHPIGLQARLQDCSKSWSLTRR